MHADNSYSCHDKHSKGNRKTLCTITLYSMVPWSLMYQYLESDNQNILLFHMADSYKQVTRLSVGTVYIFYKSMGST